jgi:hypothetical protein
MSSEVQASEAADLERAFDGFALPSSAQTEPLESGLIHKTYAIDVADDDAGDDGAARRYILQRVNPIFSLQINDNIAAVTEHLRARGVETLRLETTRSGEHYLDLKEGGVWRLMTRLPGRSFDRCPDVAHAREAGRHVSRFHAALGDFTSPLHPLGIPFHDTERHHADLASALARHPEHPLHGEVRALARVVEAADPRAKSLPRVAPRVIHGDLKFNNLLFDPVARAGAADPGPHARGLIDLDTLARMPLCFDWGDAWRSWCNRRGEDDAEAELDLEIFRAASEGLMENLGLELDRDERESLTWALELLSLETGVRFAADVLEERYFAWDPSRFESAAAHNLVRARGQLSLYTQARDSHEERARFILG